MHPDVAFLVRGQDHRHRFGVDRLDDGVRRRRQEALDVVRSGYRLRFRAAVASKLGPDASEAVEGTILVDCEPDDVLSLRLGIGLRRVFP